MFDSPTYTMRTGRDTVEGPSNDRRPTTHRQPVTQCPHPSLQMGLVYVHVHY